MLPSLLGVTTEEEEGGPDPAKGEKLQNKRLTRLTQGPQANEDSFLEGSDLRRRKKGAP